MKNVSKLLATAMVAGLISGGSAMADHHKKAGKDAAAGDKTAKKAKNACKGGKCGGKDHKKDEHNDAAAPAEEGAAPAEKTE